MWQWVRVQQYLDSSCLKLYNTLMVGAKCTTAEPITNSSTTLSLYQGYSKVLMFPTIPPFFNCHLQLSMVPPKSKHTNSAAFMSSAIQLCFKNRTRIMFGIETVSKSQLLIKRSNVRIVKLNQAFLPELGHSN